MEAGEWRAGGTQMPVQAKAQTHVESQRERKMDYETVKPEVFGRSLHGMGLNLLVGDVLWSAGFLAGVFGMGRHRVTRDFAIMTYGGQLFQIHADHTYSSNPLLSLLPESGPRGAGLEIRLYESDPDEAAARFQDLYPELEVLQAPEDKPHGLRECVLLDRDGYAWVPSRPLPG